MDELFSIPEAARRLGGVSVFTIHSWCKNGRLRKTKVGRRTMIAASALQSFLDQCNGNKSEQSRSHSTLC